VAPTYANKFTRSPRPFEDDFSAGGGGGGGGGATGLALFTLPLFLKCLLNNPSTFIAQSAKTLNKTKNFIFENFCSFYLTFNPN
jgi:hypothetical protein